jgi:hypothetical protein
MPNQKHTRGDAFRRSVPIVGFLALAESGFMLGTESPRRKDVFLNISLGAEYWGDVASPLPMGLEVSMDIQNKLTRSAAVTAGIAAAGLAVGAAAMGTFAIGALAIGALALRKVAIHGDRIEKLSVGQLTVDQLLVKDSASNSPPNAGR